MGSKGYAKHYKGFILRGCSKQLSWRITREQDIEEDELHR